MWRWAWWKVSALLCDEAGSDMGDIIAGNAMLDMYAKLSKIEATPEDVQFYINFNHPNPSRLQNRVWTTGVSTEWGWQFGASRTTTPPLRTKSGLNFRGLHNPHLQLKHHERPTKSGLNLGGFHHLRLELKHHQRMTKWERDGERGSRWTHQQSSHQPSRRWTHEQNSHGPSQKQQWIPASVRCASRSFPRRRLGSHHVRKRMRKKWSAVIEKIGHTLAWSEWATESGEKRSGDCSVERRLERKTVH